jgi:phosphoribosylformimino-5-aminoimidazole carboxamide ribotide isomerase
MPFLVIPALDLKDGRCVQLVGGDPARRIAELEDPVGVALRWQEEGARRLHVVDLDGALEGRRRNEPIVREILEALDIPVQLGGGIRSRKDAQRFLEMGAERVILGTLAFREPSVLEALADLYGPERLIVALDSKGGEVVVKGWREGTGRKAGEALRAFEASVGGVLFTNVDVEGRMGGIRMEPIRDLIESTDLEVYVSGGIASLEDIEEVRRLGARGVVIGSALYTGKIRFREAKGYESP